MSGNAPDAPGCRLPFGLGLLAFGAILVLAMTVTMTPYLGQLLTTLLNQSNSNAANPAQPGGGPGGQQTIQPHVVPVISDRFFTNGSSQATVSGALALSANLPVDVIRSYAQDGLGWIGFQSDGTELLIALNEPEESVTIVRDGRRATGVDEECTFDIEVTPNMVSGHISCPSVDVYEGGTVLGTSTIELDFSAGS